MKRHAFLDILEKSFSFIFFLVLKSHNND